jgi:DNA relaxase NicK
MRSVKTTGVVETIISLAEEIARTSPESAARAMQIAELARDLEAEPDQATVKDALDAQALDNTMSDVSTQNAAAAVVKALKE